MNYPQLRSKLSEESQYREFDFERTDDGTDEYYFEISVSSEYEGKRFYGFEVLGHKKNEIRLERFKNGAAGKDTHYGDQVCVIEKAWIDTKERKLRIGFRFSKNTERAEAIRKDVIDKIRRNVSIRYDIHEIELVKEVEGVPIYRITDWEPIHFAFEPDPFDPTVGVDRNNDTNPVTIPLDLNGNVEEQIEKFNRANNKANIKIIPVTKTRGSKLDEEEKKQFLADVRSLVQEELKNHTTSNGDKEAERAAATEYAESVMEVAIDFQPSLKEDLREKAKAHIKEGKPMREFYNYCQAQMKEPEARNKPNSFVGLEDGQTKNYSLRNIALYQMGKLGEDNVAMELEAHREIQKQDGQRVAEKKEIFIPYEVQTRRHKFDLRRLSSDERDMIVGDPSLGGVLVRDEYTQYSFIELQQMASAFMSLGIERLIGISGNIPMLREQDSFIHYYVGEGDPLTKSDIHFSKEELTPKTGGVAAVYSYKFLMQAPFVVDAYIERKMASVAALAGDYSIMYGPGGIKPLGIAYWTGVGGLEATNFDRSKALAVDALIDDDALTVGELFWVSKKKLRNQLMDVKIDSGSGLYLVNDRKEMLGYNYKRTSGQVKEGDLFFGDPSGILFGIYDDFSFKTSEHVEFLEGNVVCRGFQSHDVFPLAPEKLVYLQGVTAKVA